MDETSVTSAGNVPALPERWSEKIFRYMENFYGAKWHDSLGGIPRNRVRQAWGEELADYAPAEIARGLEACRSRVWPPTLPEFLLLCRPATDARADWLEAREQMALRLRGDGRDRWSRPQVYWAALAVGNYDLQQHGWETIRARWERALAAADDDPVPDYAAPQAALPEPGAQCVTRSVARERSSLLARQVAARLAATPGNAWALNLLRREASGEQLALVAEGAWRGVLGFGPDVPAQKALSEIEARAAAAQPARAAA